MAHRPDAGDQQPPASKRRRSTPSSTPTTYSLAQPTSEAHYQQGRVRLDEQVVFGNQFPNFVASPSAINPAPGSGDHGVFVGNPSQPMAANQLATTFFPQTTHHNQPVDPNYLMRYSGPTDRLTSQFAPHQTPFLNGYLPSSIVDSHQSSPVTANSWPFGIPAHADGIAVDPRHHQPAQFTPSPTWPSPTEQLPSGRPRRSHPPPPPSNHGSNPEVGLEDSPTSYHAERCYPNTSLSSSQQCPPGSFGISKPSGLPSPPESNPSHHRDMQSPFSTCDELQEKRDPQRGGSASTDVAAGDKNEPRLVGSETSPCATSSGNQLHEQTAGAIVPGFSFFPGSQYLFSWREDNEPARFEPPPVTSSGSQLHEQTAGAIVPGFSFFPGPQYLFSGGEDNESTRFESPRATSSGGQLDEQTTSAIGSGVPFQPECQFLSSGREDNESTTFESPEPDDEEDSDELLVASPGESHGPSGSRKGKEVEASRSKACVRCRFQKQRCILDPLDPDGPCLPCQSISRTSKKTLHRSPCFRNKITDAVLFRSGGLGLTQRWTGTEMKNVVTRLQARNPRTIQFTQSINQEPIVIQVVPFTPLPGDVTSRYWTVIENGVVVQRSKELNPFCLANIGETAAYFEQYIISNAIPDFIRRGAPGPNTEDFMGPFDPIRMTYVMAVHHYFNLPDEVEAHEGSALVANREKRLLGNLFVLWFAIRQTTGSAYICSEDTLDMAPETIDPSYPLPGKVSLPRMLLAQFDSINHTRLLVPYRVKVLRELEYLITQNKKSYWFTIYACLFILLREASWITEDRSRHARAVHQAKIRYSIPSFVESLQDGCNTLLMYWHYYNCRPMPETDDPDAKNNSFLSEITSEQYSLVMRTRKHEQVKGQLSIWRTYRTENGFLPEPEPRDDQQTVYSGSQRRIPWDHPYYWIAQLYEEDWSPHPTYQREYIP